MKQQQAKKMFAPAKAPADIVGIVVLASGRELAVEGIAVFSRIRREQIDDQIATMAGSSPQVAADAGGGGGSK